MRENRGHWYLLTGLALGIVAGLAYAWLISPVKYVDTPPSALRADFKEQYRALVAVAYLSSGDLARARARLNLLKDPEIGRTLAAQAQVSQVQARPESEVRGLSLLASVLNGGEVLPSLTPQFTASPTPKPTSASSPTPVVVLTGTLGVTLTPTNLPENLTNPTFTPAGPSATPTLTLTPLPTRTATATPGAAFVLKDQKLDCDAPFKDPLIQVEMLDAAGQPVPSVELVVRWDGNENHFFTGLKPDLGPGYADFTLTPGVSYSLQLAEGGQSIPDLVATECQNPEGERYWGAWRLTFVQP